MSKISLTQQIILAALLVLSACSNVGDFEGQDLGATSSDMRTSSEDMSSSTDMRSTCDPVPEAEACMGVCGEQSDGCGGTYDCGAPRATSDICKGACGMQPDGCGDMVECEPCACEGDVPAQPTCGPCNLGAPSCDEQGNLSCALPPIPDIETLNCELDLVYVWDEYFGASESGTKEAPFKSLKHATSAANANGSRAILIRGENTYGDGPFLATNGLSLVGGFGDEWHYDPSIRPTLKNQLVEGQDSVGVEAKNITSPAVFFNLIIETKDAAGSTNNYGIIANTANRLTLSNIQINAGKGGRGSAGVNGFDFPRDGVDGVDGSVGQKVPESPLASYQCAPSVNQETPVIDDLIVNPLCDDPEGAGGAGGAGACEAHVGQPGEQSAQGVEGGGIYYSAISRSALDGIDGHNDTLDPLGPNTKLPPGVAGTGGKRGHVQDGRWNLAMSHGGDGSEGMAGRGGGGGGGTREQDTPYASGPGGGSGGHGGCGGKEGKGGTAGGSSFGLFVVNSVGLKITDISTINSGDAGSGGNGGDGGRGGEGGQGGEGSNEACEVKDNPFNGKSSSTNCITLTYKSGDGGNGAPGLPGGPGGGGVGGDSIGIFCHESNISIDASTIISTGSPGNGGIGGEYDLQAGQTFPQPNEDGQDGIAAISQGCD